MRKMKQEHTEVPLKIDSQLANLAEAQGVTKKELLRRALKHYVSYKRGGVSSKTLNSILSELTNTIATEIRENEGEHKAIESELRSILDAQHGPSSIYGKDQ